MGSTLTNKNRINFLNIPVDALTMDETVQLISESVKSGKNINHVVINAGKVMAMQTDQELFDGVVNSDLINADGQGIVWAAKYLGTPLPERVAGIDLMHNLIELAHKNNQSCYFLGAKEDVVKKVVDFFSKKYSPQLIAGYRNGYFSSDEELTIANEIAKSGASYLFVAITSPKKEIFLNKYKNNLSSIGFTMGVGGSFDVVAGVVRRAPKWMQKAGLEWFYRFIQEPIRLWKRYMIGNYMFIKLVLKEKKNRK